MQVSATLSFMLLLPVCVCLPPRVSHTFLPNTAQIELHEVAVERGMSWDEAKGCKFRPHITLLQSLTADCFPPHNSSGDPLQDAG